MPFGRRFRLAVSGFDLKAIIRRWVHGFHAALYREYLSDDRGRFMTFPPLPEAQQHETGAIELPIAEVIPKFVDELKRNRATKTLDRIICRNGKCRYECVWSQADNGKWVCIYGLDIYNWISLGDTDTFEPRSCVGSYILEHGVVPVGATISTRLQFTVSNVARLDPFGQ